MIIPVNPDFQRINFLHPDWSELLENCFLILQEKRTKLLLLGLQRRHDFPYKNNSAFNLFAHRLINRALVERGKLLRCKRWIVTERGQSKMHVSSSFGQLFNHAEIGSPKKFVHERRNLNGVTA